MKDRLYLCAVLFSTSIEGSVPLHWIDPVVASAKEQCSCCKHCMYHMRIPSNPGCRLHASPIPQFQMRISNVTPVACWP